MYLSSTDLFHSTLHTRYVNTCSLIILLLYSIPKCDFSKFYFFSMLVVIYVTSKFSQWQMLEWTTPHMTPCTCVWTLLGSISRSGTDGWKKCMHIFNCSHITLLPKEVIITHTPTPPVVCSHCSTTRQYFRNLNLSKLMGINS